MAGPAPSSAAPWLEAAARFVPAPGWRAPGPRLFAPPSARGAWIAAVRSALQAHPGLARELRDQAAPRPVSAAPAGYVEPRLWTSCLPAAALLALAEGSPAPLDAVLHRIPSVLAMDDWVPPHHAHSRPLDLSAAGVVSDLALCLDFARELLTPAERARIAGAVVERGVRPFVEMCRAREAPWTRARHNWPTVIAGEVGLGLLAAWEAVEAGGAGGVTPEEALGHIVERIAGPLLTYPADGSYEEGPGYWHYGIGSCLPVCEALWTASGGRLDLFTLPCLAKTGGYGLHVGTPEGGCFAVEDGAPRWAAGWMLAVLGRRTGRDDLAAVGAATLGTAAGGPALRQVALLAPAAAPSAAPPPRPAPMAFFPGTQNAMLRSDWSPGAFFAGLHAGSNTVNHAHLDLGTFTVVAGGERLLADAGSWAYTLDYFRTGPGGSRWHYEPNTTAGHNALLVDGAGQDALPSAECRFHQVDLHPETGMALCSVRLAPAHGGRLQDYVRHFAFFAEGVLVVADVVSAAEPRRLAWCAHPAAAAEPLPPADGAPGRRAVPGWRWRVGEAAAELTLPLLEDRDGVVLAEVRRRTRYVDRTGRPRAYTTEALQVEPLHPVASWSLVALIRAGLAAGLPEAAAEPAGPAGLALETRFRRGSLEWSGGRLTWRDRGPAGG